MTAMRAIELPDDLADVLALAAAVHPGLSQGESLSQRPEYSAARRAAARWAHPTPPAAVPEEPRDQAASAPLRLTRRGRIVIGVAAVVLLGILSLVVAKSADATSQAPARSAQGPVQVTVDPGQSLWAVAENADPNADTRAVVQQIVELNSLTGSTVLAGERLWVPRG